MSNNKLTRSTILTTLSTLARSQTRLHLMINRLFDARFSIDKQLQRISSTERCYGVLNSPSKSEHETYILCTRNFNNLSAMKSVCSEPTTSLYEEQLSCLARQFQKTTLNNCSITPGSAPEIPTKNQENLTPRERRLQEKRDGIDRELELCFAALKVVGVKFSRMVQILRDMDNNLSSREMDKTFVCYRPSYGACV